MERAKELDQFYTKPLVAQKCFQMLSSVIELNEFELFVEPSAGNGSFLSLFPVSKRIGFDLEPKNKEIKEEDFLKITPFTKKTIVVGNPPYGKKSKKSIDFFLHATKFTNVIAFILPLQWRKWSVQKQIPLNWKLLLDELIEENSFTLNGKEVNVRCSFQIWTTNEIKNNLRIKNKPKIKHPDFKMFLYNNTKSALKFFDYDWDFAVPRQGYYDYSIRETNKNNCNKKIQWMFFKAKNNEILEKLKSIDFDKLSKRNTTTPGWGKSDLIEVYENLSC
jgi:hypothetical protein